MLLLIKPNKEKPKWEMGVGGVGDAGGGVSFPRLPILPIGQKWTLTGDPACTGINFHPRQHGLSDFNLFFLVCFLPSLTAFLECVRHWRETGDLPQGDLQFHRRDKQ